ncbi:alkaline phosphatase family protein [Leptospira semungkisensis]|uniref:Alkaline phosphatase family protein n=1 Tax=Leptospira semungkisensis TaxID=2484985 RepID=A0A4R9G723_9LEPT|nr:alkaline phosphatase family protein [Leptospira semungkisensis]TGK07251.1 alkaline phosphatase family protein [Leptospira semungkisensis]
MKRLPTNLKLIGGYAIYFELILIIYKIAFLWVYAYRLEGASVSEVLLAILVGFRFDISVIAMLLGLFAFLSSLPYLNRYKFFHFIWGYFPILIGIWLISHLIADIVYFENANKHIGYEGFVFIGKDMGVILKSAFENNPLLAVVACLLLLVFLPLSTVLFLRYNPYRYNPENWKRDTFLSAVILVVVIFAIRGGIQETPLRASNAIVSGHSFVNNIALNGVFTSIMDLKSQSIPNYLKFEREEAIRIVKEDVSYEGAEFVGKKYPLLRKQKETNPGKPPNIVLILLENWTGKFIDPISDGKISGKELTPNFNRLLRKGRFYTRFFASGGRTTNGMMSVLTGFPDRPGLTVVRTHQVLGNFSGIGNIFKDLGYETFFVTGGDLSFDNKATLMPHWGFDTVLGKKEIAAFNKFKIGAWGYDDADVLEVLHEKISQSKKPFLGVSLTLSTHYPYRAPDSKFRIFGEDERDFEYLNVYHYADWAIQDFMNRAEKSKYFDNTIFVFVADHTHHRYLDYYEDRNIPFLIYAPGKIKPAIDNRNASQLDVIPTILGLVGKETYFSAMGRNLLSPQRTESAYFAYGNLIGWIESSLFYIHFVDGNRNLKYSAIGPRGEVTLCETDPKVCESHFRKASAFLNLSHELMNQNQIFPTKEELQKKEF